MSTTNVQPLTNVRGRMSYTEYGEGDKRHELVLSPRASRERRAEPCVQLRSARACEIENRGERDVVGTAHVVPCGFVRPSSWR